MKHRSIIIFLLFSVLVFSGLVVYGDAGAVIKSVFVMSPLYWLAALGLTLVHIVIRLVRWNYYLKVLGVHADAKTSCLVFLSSMTMVMVPGRAGELAKSYFMKQKLETPFRLTAPILLAERITDLFSVMMLGLWGLIFIPFGWVLIVVTMVGISAVAVALASPKKGRLILHLPLLRRWEPFLSDSGKALRALFSLKVTVVGLVLGALTWLSLGLGFWLVLDGLESPVSMPIAVSIFCATTLVGSLSMLPGGLLTTEGGMLLLLSRVGVVSSVATASIIIIRVCTLWFAVLIGLGALIYLQKHQPEVTRRPDGPEGLPLGSRREPEVAIGRSDI